MKYALALLTVLLLTVALISFQDDRQYSDEAVTGLPWQIDILPDGNTQVFGITLGQTTLREAIERLGDDDMDVAIIAAPSEAGALEAYYSHYSAGPITGKLILIVDIDPQVLLPMRKRAFKDGGTRKYHLHPDDLPLAWRSRVKAINFMPSFNLDEEIVQARFGTPAEVLQLDAGLQHLFYPDKGLDLILDADGKEVLQYLSPAEFDAHRARIQPDENKQAPSASQVR